MQGQGRGEQGQKELSWDYRKQLFTSIYVAEKTKIPLFFVNTFIWSGLINNLKSFKRPKH